MMTGATVALTVTGWLAACTACAQSSASYNVGAPETLAELPLDGLVLGNGYPAAETELAYSVGVRPVPGAQSLRMHGLAQELFPLGMVDITATYRPSSIGDASVFGYIGLPGEPALGPPVSVMRRHAGIDSPDPARPGPWLDSSRNTSNVLTLGYTWRNLKIEGSAFSGGPQDERQALRRDPLKLDSRSGRLSFNPSENWIVQLSRGTLGGLDQLVPGGDVRRTIVSATYHRMFSEGDWQTTLAWGRNSRRFRETTVGYLLESTLRFNGAQVVFGRVEQVGSDELSRENESLQRQMFKMNKLTLGYFRDVRVSSSLNLDVGMLISRHFVPSQMVPSYGANPTAYMMFVRVKLQ